MFEEPRSHDPKPNAEERAWMATDPFKIAARITALTVLALLIGTAATEFNSMKAPTVVVTSR